jgi:hypothetical protein
MKRTGPIAPVLAAVALAVVAVLVTLAALGLLVAAAVVVQTVVAVLVGIYPARPLLLWALTQLLLVAVVVRLLLLAVETALTLFFPHSRQLVVVVAGIRVEPLPEQMAVQVAEGLMRVMLLVALAIPQALAHRRATTAVLVHRWQPRMAAAAVVVRVR